KKDSRPRRASTPWHRATCSACCRDMMPAAEAHPPRSERCTYQPSEWLLYVDAVRSPVKLARIAARAAPPCALASAASAAYQIAAEAQDRRRFPPSGRLVDVGGRRVHVMEAGEGSPAVVIVPALGENVLGWVPILQELARLTRVCVYDRAGIGWSDSPPLGR